MPIPQGVARQLTGYKCLDLKCSAGTSARHLRFAIPTGRVLGEPQRGDDNKAQPNGLGRIAIPSERKPCKGGTRHGQIPMDARWDV
jgi:hypothetical protein